MPNFLTNLLFEPKGKHDPALTYSIKDTVMSADGSQVYFALQDVPAGIALGDESYWKLQIDLSGSKNAMDEAVANFSDYAKIVGTRVRGETAKATGNPVTLLPDAGSLLQPVTVLEPRQAGSGEPSPDNIRPITGYDAVKLTAAGKNVFNVNGEIAGTNPIVRIENNKIVIDSLADGNVSYVSYGAMHKRGKYTFSAKLIGEKATAIRIVTSAEHTGGQYNAVYGGWFSDISSGGRIVFETAADFGVTIVIVGDVGTAAEAYDITLAYGDVDAAYAPYAGTLHTVQIGQTVYGGKFDWLTGKLIVDKGYIVFNGTEKWVETIEGNIKYIYYSPTEKPQDGYVVCSHMPFVYDYQGNGTYCHNKLIIVGAGMYSRYGTIAKWKEFLAAEYAAGTPVQIVYKLATPIEIGPFTPQIISAADPEQTNTLYGDGSIEVEYVKPLHVSIEERVAAALAAMTE